MTARENISLQSFIQEYRRDKAEDKLWKNEFKQWRDKVVTPLVKQDSDNKIVTKWIQGQSFHFVKIAGGILTVLLLLDAIFNGFFRSIFQTILFQKK